MAKKPVTEKRVGPPCPTCGKPQNISGTPKSAEELAAKEALYAKRLAKLQAAKVATVVKVEPKKDEAAG